ncbi:hypothetical protein LTSERUB_3112, partial [Salmonella enterica subsp. enterica serovar Rubislaw str. A4-653]
MVATTIKPIWSLSIPAISIARGAIRSGKAH